MVNGNAHNFQEIINLRNLTKLPELKEQTGALNNLDYSLEYMHKVWEQECFMVQSESGWRTSKFLV